jgi:hypothetical protein
MPYGRFTDKQFVAETVSAIFFCMITNELLVLRFHVYVLIICALFDVLIHRDYVQLYLIRILIACLTWEIHEYNINSLEKNVTFNNTKVTVIIWLIVLIWRVENKTVLSTYMFTRVIPKYRRV